MGNAGAICVVRKGCVWSDIPEHAQARSHDRATCGFTAAAKQPEPQLQSQTVLHVHADVSQIPLLSLPQNPTVPLLPEQMIHPCYGCSPPHHCLHGQTALSRPLLHRYLGRGCRKHRPAYKHEPRVGPSPLYFIMPRRLSFALRRCLLRAHPRILAWRCRSVFSHRSRPQIWNQPPRSCQAFPRKRSSKHNSLTWPLPSDLTIKAFSMLDTQSLCYAAASCSMFQKCAVDPLCYANLDLTTVVPKVNNAIVATMIQRAGEAFGSCQPLVYSIWSSVDVSIFSWNDKKMRQGKESSVLTRYCLNPLSGESTAAG